MNSKNKTKKLLLLGILLFGFTASGWSQKVSLNFKDEKIEKVLSSIKSQTGMALVFSDQVVDVNRLVSIQVKDCNLEEALGKLLTGTKVAYEIKNNKIYFIEKESEITIIRKSKFPWFPERSVQFSGKRTKRSVQKKRLHTTLIKPEQKVNEDLCSGFIVS